jgi:formylmethanofuran dehydrogenase subunit E
MRIGTCSFGEFKEKATAFHGYPAPGLLIGGYMVEAARSRLEPGILFEALVETPKRLPDAVQLLTLCSEGNQRMKVINLGRYALTLFDKYSGLGFRAHLDVDQLDPWPQIRGWFLKLTAKDQQNPRMLDQEIEMAGDTICTVKRVRVAPGFMGRSHMSSIVRCPVCLEAYPAGDGAVCRGCQGEAPYTDLEQPDRF